MPNSQYELRKTGKVLERVKRKMAVKEPIRIIAYGDSISDCDRKPGWFGGAKLRENWWGYRLERILNDRFPGQVFWTKSFGIGGQNAYEGVGRMFWLNDMLPDLVLLEFGINDCGYTDIPPASTGTALTRIIEHIDARLQSDIMIAGIAGDNPLSPPNNHFEETSQAIREVAKTKYVPFVDLRTPVLKATENGRCWEEYHNGVNNCHPNDKGHGLWADIFFKSIVPLISL